MSAAQLLSAVASALTLIGFAPYIRAILRGQAQPHPFSWFIWGGSTLTVSLAQLAAGGGAGAWPIGLSGLISLYIALLAHQRCPKEQITTGDRRLLALAASALPLWYLTADPLWAVVILTTVDLLGFGPTLRKAYAHPFAESLLFFSLFALRNAIAILALAHHSLTTILFPAATGAACLLLIALLALRRRQLAPR